MCTKCMILFIIILSCTHTPTSTQTINEKWFTFLESVPKSEEMNVYLELTLIKRGSPKITCGALCTATDSCVGMEVCAGDLCRLWNDGFTNIDAVTRILTPTDQCRCYTKNSARNSSCHTCPRKDKVSINEISSRFNEGLESETSQSPIANTESTKLQDDFITVFVNELITSNPWSTKPGSDVTSAPSTFLERTTEGLKYPVKAANLPREELSTVEEKTTDTHRINGKSERTTVVDITIEASKTYDSTTAAAETITSLSVEETIDELTSEETSTIDVLKTVVKNPIEALKSESYFKFDETTVGFKINPTTVAERTNNVVTSYSTNSAKSSITNSDLNSFAEITRNAQMQKTDVAAEESATDRQPDATSVVEKTTQNDKGTTIDIESESFSVIESKGDLKSEDIAVAYEPTASTKYNSDSTGERTSTALTVAEKIPEGIQYNTPSDLKSDTSTGIEGLPNTLALDTVSVAKNTFGPDVSESDLTAFTDVPKSELNTVYLEPVETSTNVFTLDVSEKPFSVLKSHPRIFTEEATIHTSNSPSSTANHIRSLRSDPSADNVKTNDILTFTQTSIRRDKRTTGHQDNLKSEVASMSKTDPLVERTTGILKSEPRSMTDITSIDPKSDSRTGSRRTTRVQASGTRTEDKISDSTFFTERITDDIHSNNLADMTSKDLKYTPSIISLRTFGVLTSDLLRITSDTGTLFKTKTNVHQSESTDSVSKSITNLKSHSETLAEGTTKHPVSERLTINENTLDARKVEEPIDITTRDLKSNRITVAEQSTNKLKADVLDVEGMPTYNVVLERDPTTVRTNDGVLKSKTTNVVDDTIDYINSDPPALPIRATEIHTIDPVSIAEKTTGPPNTDITTNVDVKRTRAITSSKSPDIKTSPSDFKTTDLISHQADRETDLTFSPKVSTGVLKFRSTTFGDENTKTTMGSKFDSATVGEETDKVKTIVAGRTTDQYLITVVERKKEAPKPSTIDDNSVDLATVDVMSDPAFPTVTSDILKSTTIGEKTSIGQNLNSVTILKTKYITETSAVEKTTDIYQNTDFEKITDKSTPPTVDHKTTTGLKSDHGTIPDLEINALTSMQTTRSVAQRRTDGLNSETFSSDKTTVAHHPNPATPEQVTNVPKSYTTRVTAKPTGYHKSDLSFLDEQPTNVLTSTPIMDMYKTTKLGSSTSGAERISNVLTSSDPNNIAEGSISTLKSNTIINSDKTIIRLKTDTFSNVDRTTRVFATHKTTSDGRTYDALKSETYSSVASNGRQSYSSFVTDYKTIDVKSDSVTVDEKETSNFLPHKFTDAEEDFDVLKYVIPTTVKRASYDLLSDSSTVTDYKDTGPKSDSAIVDEKTTDVFKSSLSSSSVNVVDQDNDKERADDHTSLPTRIPVGTTLLNTSTTADNTSAIIMSDENSVTQRTIDLLDSDYSTKSTTTDVQKITLNTVDEITKLTPDPVKTEPKIGSEMTTDLKPSPSSYPSKAFDSYPTGVAEITTEVLESDLIINPERTVVLNSIQSLYTNSVVGRTTGTLKSDSTTVSESRFGVTKSHVTSDLERSTKDLRSESIVAAGQTTTSSTAATTTFAERKASFHISDQLKPINFLKPTDDTTITFRMVVHSEKTVDTEKRTNFFTSAGTNVDARTTGEMKSELSLVDERETNGLATDSIGSIKMSTGEPKLGPASPADKTTSSLIQFADDEKSTFKLFDPEDAAQSTMYDMTDVLKSEPTVVTEEATTVIKAIPDLVGVRKTNFIPSKSTTTQFLKSERTDIAKRTIAFDLSTIIKSTTDIPTSEKTSIAETTNVPDVINSNQARSIVLTSNLIESDPTMLVKQTVNDLHLYPNTDVSVVTNIFQKYSGDTEGLRFDTITGAEKTVSTTLFKTATIDKTTEAITNDSATVTVISTQRLNIAQTDVTATPNSIIEFSQAPESDKATEILKYDQTTNVNEAPTESAAVSFKKLSSPP